MFLHTTEEGQKEAERFICQSHQHGLPSLNLEADVPIIQLVGYQTSQKEIRDLYHEVYLLRRLPALPPSGSQWREEAIQDILSSLRSCFGDEAALPFWRRTNGGLLQPPHGQYAIQNPDPGPRGETTPTIKPSERPERLTSGHWRPPICQS